MDFNIQLNTKPPIEFNRHGKMLKHLRSKGCLIPKLINKKYKKLSSIRLTKNTNFLESLTN